MDEPQDSNRFNAELHDGLAKARDAVFGKENGWKVITYKQLEPLGVAAVELAKNFTAEELVVLGAFVTAMARQQLTFAPA